MYFELECISCYASVNWGQTDWDIRHCPHKMRALGHLSLIEWAFCQYRKWYFYFLMINGKYVKKCQQIYLQNFSLGVLFSIQKTQPSACLTFTTVKSLWCSYFSYLYLLFTTGYCYDVIWWDCIFQDKSRLQNKFHMQLVQILGLSLSLGYTILFAKSLIFHCMGQPLFCKGWLQEAIYAIQYTCICAHLKQHYLLFC